MSLNTAIAQNLPAKEVTTAEQSWMGFVNQSRISDHWGMTADIHYRRKGEFYRESAQFLVRGGVLYHFSDDFRLAAGYAYSYLFGENGNIGRPEHRPWQQIWWRQTYEGFQLVHSSRLEERFRQIAVKNELIEEYNFNYRFRYSLSVSIPLKGKKLAPKIPYLIFAEEIFINFGKEIVYNYFDSNRLMGGIGYQFDKNFNLQLCYMNIFQQQNSGYEFIDTHVIRCYLFHNIDFRNEKD